MTEYTARLLAPGDFGLALQQARFARGMTQAQLAEQLSTQQSTISEMENGSGTLYVRRLLEMARATGLQLSATWEVDDAPGS